jgi:hypothetical protein
MAESIHARRNLARAKHFGLVQDDEPAAEPEEVDDLSEFHVGGGWYQIGDEKVQGKDAARELLEEN